MSLLVNAGPYSLTKTWYVDGTATDVGDVTIGVTDANGDTVVAAATATTNNADGTYTYSLADQTEPNLLTVTWTRSDTSADLADQVEVVGARLFSEAAFRTHNDDQFSSETRYPDSAVAAARDAVTEQLELWTGRSWVTRYCRLVAAGDGGRLLDLRTGDTRTSSGTMLHRPGRTHDLDTVLSASVGGSSVTASNLVLNGGYLHRTDGTWSAATVSNPMNVVVEYSYGLAYPTDGVDRIAMLLAADRLRESILSTRATTWSDEFGQYRFETPGRAGNVSTIPEVNEWVKAHRAPLMVA